MRSVAIVILLVALTLPSLPMTAASDECAAAGNMCVATPGLPAPIPGYGAGPFYVYLPGGCPKPSSSGCHVSGILYAESNGAAGLQRTNQLRTYADTVVLY